MTAGTHYAFSYLLCTASGFDQKTALIASLFALLPDIDHPVSMIGRVFSGISKYVLRKYGHRTVTHSVFAVGVIAVLLSPALFFSYAFYFAAVLAFSSHLFIDLFNVGGVKLFAPVSQKEYISFKTPELRILVNSWKEYVLLFVIVLSAVTLSGQSFSMSKAVRSVSKFFYKTYDGAIKDFQANSSMQCIAEVSYFDNVSRKMVFEKFTVLTLLPEKAYLLKNSERFILKKTDISEIDIKETSSPAKVKVLEGKDLALLSDVQAGSFITGIMTVNVCPHDIKNSDFVKEERGMNSVKFTFTYANPDELSEIVSIDKARKDEIEHLRMGLASYQIELLSKKERLLKAELSKLKRKGFYNNYSSITAKNDELKKVKSKVESLKLSVSAGADQETQRKIDELGEKFFVEYTLYVFETSGN
ncbi:MAG: metal-dependent hydrolase [Candidatus Aureabacteria bacterium]|nr:metal-dependent hydrolase [Candidatus Auribacterota bacterium]